MLASVAIFIATSLLASLANAVTVVVNDPPADTTPPCLRECLRAYAGYAPAHGSNCEPADNDCVCRDPFLGAYIACCMADSCSNEVNEGAAYLDFQCKMSGVQLPDLTDCDRAKADQKNGEVSFISVTLYSTESDGKLRSVMGSAPPVTTAVTTEDASSVTSTTSHPVASVTSTSSNTKPATANPPAPVTTTSHALLPPLTPGTGIGKPVQTAPFPLTNAQSSSSISSSSAGPATSDQQSTKPLTLGLSIGLGIPLSMAVVGVLSFLLYRRRKQDSFESDSFFMGGPYVSEMGGTGYHQPQTPYAGDWKPEMPGDQSAYAPQRTGGGRCEGGRVEMPS